MTSLGSLRALLAVGALGFLLAASSDAFAYCRTTTCDPGAGDDCRKNDDGCVRDGVPLKWKTSPVVYRFHSAGSSKLDTSGARAAIRRAFEEWSNQECKGGRTSLRFEEGDEVDEDKPLRAKSTPIQKFGIYFRDDEWPHDDAEESLALTNQTYGKTSGNIEYADIEINTANTTFRLTDAEAQGIDLQAVMTHEAGHYIGLAHSNDEESIMVARYCVSADRCGQGVDQSRQLSADDVRAVCAVYPPARDTAAPPAAGCSQSSTPLLARPADLIGAGAWLFVGCALLRRRLRDRG